MTKSEQRAERSIEKKDRMAKARAARMTKGGRPKGQKNAATLEKEREKKALDQFYLRMQRRINTAQASLAIGQTFLYKIEKKEIIGPKGGVSYENQKPELVTSQHEIENYLTELAENNGELEDTNDPATTYYFLTTKEPNNEAIKDILNRVHGKPKETQEVNVNQTFSLVALSKQREAIDGNLDAQIIHEHAELPPPSAA